MRVSTAALALSAALTAAACGQDRADPVEGSADLTRAEIETIVRSYILENPEIIEQAIIALRDQREREEIAAVADNIEEARAAIYEDPRAPRIGPETADIVIVEFLDYRCPYCQVAGEWLAETVEANPDRVQVIFKEFPVLGEQSQDAARAALAAWAQGPDVYWRFHQALINASGPLPAERIDDLAADAGVDVAAMRAAIGAESDEAYIADVRALAEDLGVSGTPFFIVNGEAVYGADIQRLEAIVQAALDG